MPNQQRTVNKIPTELRCRNFVNKRRLSIQIGAKHAETYMQCVCIPTELPFCIPQLVVGWYCQYSPRSRRRKKLSTKLVLLPQLSLPQEEKKLPKTQKKLHKLAVDCSRHVTHSHTLCGKMTLNLECLKMIKRGRCSIYLAHPVMDMSHTALFKEVASKAVPPSLPPSLPLLQLPEFGRWKLSSTNNKKCTLPFSQKKARGKKALKRGFQIDYQKNEERRKKKGQNWQLPFFFFLTRTDPV